MIFMTKIIFIKVKAKILNILAIRINSKKSS